MENDDEKQPDKTRPTRGDCTGPAGAAGPLVRKLETAIDFSFIYPLVEGLYSKLGRPSIDPVVLFKMTFIQYVFGIRSMRQTIKEIETNVAYRWFLGFGFYTEVPHFSTFGKLKRNWYARRSAPTRQSSRRS